MNKAFIDAVQQTINARYHLSRDKKEWILEENDLQTQTRVRAPTRDSIAFSLDKNNLKPFGFLASNPPKDLTKMCDAILFCCSKNDAYLFIIEKKTANKGHYKKQLINGKLFCDWLIALYIQHGFSELNVTIVPLLIWKPQEKSPYKGETSHREDGGSIKKKEFSQFDREGFEIVNRCTVPVIELISRLERA